MIPGNPRRFTPTSHDCRGVDFDLGFWPKKALTNDACRGSTRLSKKLGSRRRSFAMAGESFRSYVFDHLYEVLETSPGGL
jgi:hypothetical protein